MFRCLSTLPDCNCFLQHQSRPGWLVGCSANPGQGRQGPHHCKRRQPVSCFNRIYFFVLRARGTWLPVTPARPRDKCFSCTIALHSVATSCMPESESEERSVAHLDCAVVWITIMDMIMAAIHAIDDDRRTASDRPGSRRGPAHIMTLMT